MLMNYATYWKQAAGEAIRRHNDHIERCNRVIEAGENGVPLGDVAEGLRLRRRTGGEPDRSPQSDDNNKRLQPDLEQKAAIVDLSHRVMMPRRKWATARTGNGAKGAQHSGPGCSPLSSGSTVWKKL